MKKIFDLKIRNMSIALGIVINMGIAVAYSVLLGGLLDRIIERSSFDKEILISILMLLILTIALSLSKVFLGEFFPLRMDLRKSIENTRKIQKGVLSLSQKNYNREDKGYYINLVTSTAFTCGDLYVHINIELIGNIIGLVCLLGYTMYVNPILGILFFLYMPIYALLSKKPNKKIAQYQKNGLEKQDAFLNETKRVVEDKRAINIAKADEHFENRYYDISEKYLAFITKFKWYSILSTNIPGMLSSILTVLAIAISAYLYYEKAVTIGTILISFQLSQIIQEPINRVIEIFIHWSINKVHAERMQEFAERVLQGNPFNKNYKRAEHLFKVSQGKMYATEEKENILFSMHDFQINKGELTIIKGGNGSGKSTLFNYITGMADENQFEGDIEIDGSMQKAAYLSYPILVVKGTLLDNMFNKPIMEEAYQMLRVTFDRDLIEESGTSISFGEQQKLNLLRVLSLDTDVILLDEPFTNLDKETIQRLCEYIKGLKGKKSVIAITHSPELDQAADAIWEIEQNSLKKKK